MRRERWTRGAEMADGGVSGFGQRKADVPRSARGDPSEISPRTRLGWHGGHVLLLLDREERRAAFRDGGARRRSHRSDRGAPAQISSALGSLPEISMVNWTMWPISTVSMAGARETLSGGGIHPGARSTEAAGPFMSCADWPAGTRCNTAASRCDRVRPHARWKRRPGNRDHH